MASTPARINQTISSDFHRDLTVVPGKADLARKVNEEAIKESIKNLVLTNKGERPFQPTLGCDVRRLLFENITPQTLIVIENTIKDTIDAYEPRCNLIAVDATSAIDTNDITITIVFSLINSSEPITFSLILDRVR